MRQDSSPHFPFTSDRSSAPVHNVVFPVQRPDLDEPYSVLGVGRRNVVDRICWKNRGGDIEKGRGN